MTITGSIRTVWPPKQPGGRFVVIVQEEPNWRRHVLWTRSEWWASLCDQYANPARRLEVTVEMDANTDEITRVGPVADPVPFRVTVGSCCARRLNPRDRTATRCA